MTDVSRTDVELERLAALYRGNEEARFDVALLCADVVRKRNGKTLEVAARLRCSDDTVERLARGGRTFRTLRDSNPHAAEQWRDELTVSHFERLGRRMEKDIVDLAEAKKLLNKACAEQMTVEQFNKSLPPMPTDNPPSYRKTAEKYLAKLPVDLINAPFTDCDEDLAVKVSEAAQYLMDALSELLAVAEPS